MLRLQIFQENPDLGAMLKFWSAVYPGKPAAESYFNWRYLNPQFTPTTLTIWDGSQLAGSHSCLRLPACVSGETSKAAFFFDTLIHPEHQNRGLVVPLFLELDRLMTAAGVAVKFGFPNLKMVPVVSAVPKWSCLRPMPVMTASVALLASRPSCNPLSAHARGIGNTLPPEGVQLLADGELRGAYSFTIRRSLELYSWRLAPESGRAYHWLMLRSGGQTAAVVIYKLFRGATDRLCAADLIDFAVRTPELLDSVLLALAKEWWAVGVECVSAWAGSGISATDLKRVGFVETKPYWHLGYSGDSRAMDSPLLTFLESDVF